MRIFKIPPVFFLKKAVRTTCDGALFNMFGRMVVQICGVACAAYLICFTRPFGWKQNRSALVAVLRSCARKATCGETQTQKANIFWSFHLGEQDLLTESCNVTFNMLRASDSVLGIEVRRYLDNLVAKKLATKNISCFWESSPQVHAALKISHTHSAVPASSGLPILLVNWAGKDSWPGHGPTSTSWCGRQDLHLIGSYSLRKFTWQPSDIRTRSQSQRIVK